MLMKTGEIVFLYITLNEIASSDKIEEAPIDVKFLLVRNARAIQPIADEFNNTRAKLLMENSSPDEENDNNNRVASAEQLKFINEEISKLEEVEVEVAVTPISLSKLEPLKLGMIQLSGLYPIIKEEAY